MTPAYRTEAEIEEVVRRFEDCSYTPEEFVHARHVTVAAIYLIRFERDAAKERMRAGLRKFIKHHGKNGYHETITEFWLARIEREVAQHSSKASNLVSFVNDVLTGCGDKESIYEFYSRERIASAEAKVHRLEPDLKPIAV